MKKLTNQLILILLIHIFLIILNAGFLYYAVKTLENDAEMINLTGVVRGSIQQATKIALSGGDCSANAVKIDQLLKKLSSPIHYKIWGHGSRYSEKLAALSENWIQFKKTLRKYEQEPSEELHLIILSESEKLWDMADNTVFSAQHATEEKLKLLDYLLGLVVLELLVIAFVFYLIKKHVRDKLEIQAHYDPLTNIYNRRVFNERLKEEIARSTRKGYAMALAIFDLDLFKKINDNHGHQVGDEILCSVAGLIAELKRSSDILCRVGGEEFALIAPETDLKGALAVAEKIRRNIEKSTLGLPMDACVTTSVGVTEFKEGDTANSIYKRADEALYKAKKEGRNCVASDE